MSTFWRIVGHAMALSPMLDLMTHRRFRSREAAAAYVLLYLDAQIVDSEADLVGSEPRVYIEEVTWWPGYRAGTSYRSSNWIHSVLEDAFVIGTPLATLSYKGHHVHAAWYALCRDGSLFLRCTEIQILFDTNSVRTPAFPRVIGLEFTASDLPEGMTGLDELLAEARDMLRIARQGTRWRPSDEAWP